MDGATIETIAKLVYLVAACALGILLVTPRPRRAVNLALAAFVVAQAAQLWVDTIARAVPDRTLAYNLKLARSSSLVVLDVLYLAFIREALDIRLLRPLRTRAGAWGIGVASLAILLPFVFPLATVPSMTRGASGWVASEGPLSHAIAYADALFLAFVLICTLIAIREAPPGTTHRSRAKAYALAFVLQDALILAIYATDFVGGRPGTLAWADTLLAVGLFASSLILAWALLKYQLFDFELKVKLTIRRGTVVGIFVAVFFVVAEVMSNFLAGTAGYAVGGVAAGLMLFAIRPLERLADRVADTAMPRVQSSPAYAQFKKLEVYRAAIETALEDDGVIDAKERRMLDGLRAKLAIHDADAAALEDEVRGLASDAQTTPRHSS